MKLELTLSEIKALIFVVRSAIFHNSQIDNKESVVICGAASGLCEKLMMIRDGMENEVKKTSGESTEAQPEATAPAEVDGGAVAGN